MRLMITRLALLLSLLAAPAALAQTATVREEIQVSVDGRPETWRLVWDGPTRPFCGLDDLATADTGPCNGFAYGEQGALFLERRGADGTLLDRLELAPAFRDSDLDGLDIGNAALPRWPVEVGDRDITAIQARPPVPIMALADYGGDGKALEFLFQTKVELPDGGYYAAAGLNSASGRLHLLSSYAQPDRALVRSKVNWQTLAQDGREAELLRFWVFFGHPPDLTAADVKAAQAQTATMREEIQVSVDGRPETWRLVWDGSTRPFCGLDDLAMAGIGPCNGFAYGEQGALFLERRGADGTLLDRLALAPAFRDSDLEGLDTGNAALPRWPVEVGDGNMAKAGAADIAAFTVRVQARPPVPIMALADYDGDGKALEFLFQTNVLPTSKQYYAAAGIDPATGRLHLLHSTARPDRALVLSKAAWQALAQGGPPTEVPFWACDDHGADIRQTYRLVAQKGQISVTIRDYDCASSALQKEEAW